MYVDVKVGQRGEIVIPAFIRQKLKIRPGEQIMVSEESDRIELIPKKKDVLKRWREIARAANLREEDLVYGDELYEEALG